MSSFQGHPLDKPLCAVAALAWMAGASPAALAHDAGNGWSYPLSCCSGMDCADIPASRVSETAGGYRIELSPADHAMLAAPRAYDVPYTDARVKIAPDGLYHACISRQVVASGRSHGGSLICLFAPPKGF